MTGIRVAGLGIPTVDILTRVEKLPASDEVFEAVSVDVQGGGPVATALVTLARLGIPTSFIGSVVKDNWGHIILEEFSQFGVCTDYCRKEESGQSAISVILIEQESGSRAILYQKKRLPEFDPVHIPVEVIKEAEILHLEGTFHQAALQAAAMAKSFGKKVSFDGSAGKYWKESMDLLPLADILIVARRYASHVTGWQDPYRAGRSLIEYGAELVIITDGKNGCWYMDAGQSFHQPAFQVEVQDTTGAGDVFHGAYLYAYLQGWEPGQAARFASAAAALKCTQAGGRKGIPVCSQVLSFLDQAQERTS